MNRRFIVLVIAALFLGGVAVLYGTTPSPKDSGVLPGVGSNQAYVTTCPRPWAVVFSGTPAQADAWVAKEIASKIGECLTTTYLNGTIPTTTTTAPFNWVPWCAAHPYYYNPAICPTHLPHTTTTTKGTT